ncbi:MAG: N-acetyltransferase family protein [Ferruginibacter sp.]
MTFRIRRAKKEDCPAMMVLIQELAIYERAPEQVTVSMDHFMESGFGEHPVWWAFVAEVPQSDHTWTIVGFALYYIRYSTWKGQRMYLEDIIVTESMRGKGIGKGLFHALIDEYQTRGLHGMVWQVLEWNQPAIDFYKRFDGVELDAEWVNGSLELTRRSVG